MNETRNRVISKDVDLDPKNNPRDMPQQKKR